MRSTDRKAKVRSHLLVTYISHYPTSEAKEAPETVPRLHKALAFLKGDKGLHSRLSRDISYFIY